jgi:phospholipid transport system substrate-binding protein
MTPGNGNKFQVGYLTIFGFDLCCGCCRRLKAILLKPIKVLTLHMTMKKGLVIVGILWSLSTSSYAEQPLDILRNSVDESINILNDSGYEDSSRKDTQRQKLWLILKQIFDFQEFTKLALGRNWNTFTPPQQREFTELFSKFVNIYYLTRLQDRYHNEEVRFINQNLISSTRAVVHVKVLWKNQEVPVDRIPGEFMILWPWASVR